MKKIPYFIITIIVLLISPLIVKGKEVTSPTIYSIVEQGTKLTPDSFIPMLEKTEEITIDNIEFTDTSRGNTITTGIFKTSVTFSDSSQQKQTEKLSYLVYPKEPTLFFNTLNYDAKTKELEVLLHNSSATIYLIADQQTYELSLDQNGRFKGKYNPSQLPKEITFIAFEENGNWSSRNVLNTATKQIKEHKTPLTATEYSDLEKNSTLLLPSNSHKTFITRSLIFLLLLILVLGIISYHYGKHHKQN